MGVALRLLSDKNLNPSSFKGGDESACFRTLERPQFVLHDKKQWPFATDRDDNIIPRKKSRYGNKRTREWVVEAIRALSGKRPANSLLSAAR